VRRCIWLLDLDGVLNGFGRCGWSAHPCRRRIVAGGVEWRMRWAPQLIDQIRDLYDSAAVEIRWATSWIDHNISRIEFLMGLPSFPTAYPPGTAGPDGHPVAKLAAALGVIDAGHRLIWTDDDAIPAGGSARDALEAAGALLIAPDLHRALRPEHLNQIRDYLHAPDDRLESAF